MSDETIALALIVTAATGAQLLAVRLRIPPIVPLLAAGVALGPYAIDVIDPGQLLGELLQPLVNLSVAVILFEGALTLRREELSEAGVGGVVGRLVSLGVLITWLFATAGALLLLGIDFRIAIILGAVLTLSGPTVVLPMLDFVRPQRRVGTILRWEGILVDPIGAILAVLTFGVVASGSGGEFAAGAFAGTVAVGAAVGAIGSILLAPILRSPRYNDSLKSGTTLGLVLAAAAVASGIAEDAGLVAAIAMGVALANGYGEVIEETAAFTETLVGLFIGGLFIILSARVDPAAVIDLEFGGLAFVALLVVVVRPLAIAAATARSRLELRERAFMAWMMPRGIVAAATVSAFHFELVEEGVPDADMLIPATFLVIATTVVLYGLSAGAVAARLGVRERDG